MKVNLYKFDDIIQAESLVKVLGPFNKIEIDFERLSGDGKNILVFDRDQSFWSENGDSDKSFCRIEIN